MFFEKEEIKRDIKAFINNSNSISFEGLSEQKMFNISLLILNDIVEQPRVWDENCRFNIEHIGDNFISVINKFSSIEPRLIEQIYVILFRFLCELDFRLDKTISIELLNVKSQVLDGIESSSSNLRSQIIYSAYAMPADILKTIINSPAVASFQAFNDTIEQAKKLKTDWDSDISQKTATVDAIKNNLEKYKTGFNFVGLYDGFDQLSKTKKFEIKWLFLSLLTMGVVILSPMIIEIVISIYNSKNGNELTLSSLYTVIPIISIEIILIYYFRIILSQYTSVKAQLVQIELRKTLCQFIQSYSDYSVKIKEKDSNVLEKFENLIFSSVLTDPEKIPSTFDGLEQIGSLIKTLKSS